MASPTNLFWPKTQAVKTPNQNTRGFLETLKSDLGEYQLTKSEVMSFKNYVQNFMWMDFFFFFPLRESIVFNRFPK